MIKIFQGVWLLQIRREHVLRMSVESYISSNDEKIRKKKRMPPYYTGEYKYPCPCFSRSRTERKQKENKPITGPFQRHPLRRAPVVASRRDLSTPSSKCPRWRVTHFSASWLCRHWADHLPSSSPSRSHSSVERPYHYPHRPTLIQPLQCRNTEHLPAAERCISKWALLNVVDASLAVDMDEVG